MNSYGLEYGLARSHEIDRRVKQAVRHQQDYYRDEMVFPVRKVSLWRGAWKRMLSWFAVPRGIHMMNARQFPTG